METFKKKEKEKARQKKRKDKEEKRDERRANTQKGQPFAEMLAYVDENGNISSTPPDPRRKTSIDVDTIQIGVARQEDMEPQDTVRQGIVTFFNSAKGYGFIRDLQSQESIFVHMNGLVDAINEQDKVSFEITMTPKGANAVGVRKNA
ncbi:cold shock domain-containing protein [Spirosoma taeanense]|uniref:Cold shock domain-containing protein n=1 Tax=Spirosoma taeanense TaxID=2735870 RepID=A0A6M5Y1B9_9BACT|nr:cold shock domain-containing protein [Spirosoma taeanense]QJW88517.1 cold shock domain-containing protein [Spirosoma taeanense]